MAQLLRPDGTNEEVQPADGKQFKLDELYKLVDCRMIEMVYLGGFFKDKVMIIDEEGKFSNGGHPKPANDQATVVFKSLPRLPGDYIAGNALVCSLKEVD